MEMDVLFIGAGVILACVLVFNFVKKLMETSVKQLPPGPHGLPIIGMAGQLSINSAHLKFTEWSELYGEIYMFENFGRKVVVLNNPDLIRKTFSDNTLASVTNDRPSSFIGRYVADSYKDVLFRRYDEVCHSLKQTTMKIMHACGTQSVVHKTLQQEEINEYIAELTRLPGEDVDIIRPLEATLCKLIGILFTGRRLGSEDSTFKAIVKFDKCGNEMIMPSTHLTLKLLPWLRYLPGYYGNLYRRTMSSKSDLATELVKKLECEYRTTQRSCLLHALFSIQADEKWLTDDLILGIVMDLINTSTLTSRGVLSGIYFLLIHNQTIQDRVREEIDHVVGHHRQPDTDDMSSMPFTHACILETLRFQSHLAITATHTNSTDIEIGGFFIPKGTSLYGNQWKVHHDETFWEDPWTFRPERFLDEHGQLLPRDHERRLRFYMPFGTGSRSCMGVTTTYHRMFLFVTTLLQNHKILPPSEATLPSSDPRDLTPGTVLQVPNFLCRVVAR